MRTIILIRAVSLLLALVAFSTASFAQQPVYTNITLIYSDADGTPFAATDRTGQEAWKIEHQPYGEEYSNTQVVRKNNLSFAGKPYDEEIGLSYFGARWYDPALGRFTGVDPAQIRPSNYKTFNRFSYANNNPYRYVDPDGRDAEIVIQPSGDININIPITFTGPAASNAKVVADIKSDISKVWSGVHIVDGKKQNITVQVTTPSKGGVSNTIKLLNGPTSFKPTGGSSFVRGGNTGEWDVTSPGIKFGEAAHEAGHLMGAKDHYKSTFDSKGVRNGTEPKAGFKGNLMGQLPGKVDSRNFSEILKSKNNKVTKRKK